jgi:NADH-quinone oxidoreductase subunit F/NADP-reducing hydrogenase subunit HndC
MSKKFKINKEKCLGCGTCTQTCPNSTKIGDDMKAIILDNEKIERCGGAKICPFGAIEEIEEEDK